MNKKLKTFLLIFFGASFGASGIALFINTALTKPVNLLLIIISILLFSLGLGLSVLYEG